MSSSPPPSAMQAGPPQAEMPPPQQPDHARRKPATLESLPADILLQIGELLPHKDFVCAAP